MAELHAGLRIAIEHQNGEIDYGRIEHSIDHAWLGTCCSDAVAVLIIESGVGEDRRLRALIQHHSGEWYDFAGNRVAISRQTERKIA
ncbi:MAG TPA: hypothetical protein VG273_16365 [Bryobacteraceae bacterium]|jgi:hypothetical protein|nr:hypothetical protein [Bryobacteraceae bacterium]